MKLKPWSFLSSSLLTLALTGCYHPPYNNYRPYNPLPSNAATGAAVGTIVGAAAGTPITGTIIGGVLGTGAGLYKSTRGYLLNQLRKNDVQYVQYGDTMTLIVPVNCYYEFNSAKLNDLDHPGLEAIARLLRYYSHSKIYVAAFTDDIGTTKHQSRLSQAQAETMLGFLWANGVKAQRLDAAGYGSKFPIGDNELIRGSAFNRRIEIQWTNGELAQLEQSPALGVGK